MGQIEPTLATGFILRVQEQMRWLETQLATLSPRTDSFVSEQQAIAGAMNELRTLMHAEPPRNDGQSDYRERARQIEEERDPQRTAESVGHS
jgi:hypothetical protein